jgi:hypothetical protein
LAASAAAPRKATLEEKLPAYTNPVSKEEVSEIFAVFEAIEIDRFRLARLFVAGEQTLRRWMNGHSDVPHPGQFRLSVWALAQQHGVTNKVRAIFRRHGGWDAILTPSPTTT